VHGRNILKRLEKMEHVFRILLGQGAPSGGQVKIGPSVQIGTYVQEHETLDYERTLIDTVRQAAKLSEDAAVRFLGFCLTPPRCWGIICSHVSRSGNW